MKKIYLCLIVYITALTVSAAAEQTPSTHSWVDLSQYSDDESVKTVTRADLKQLMYEFQNDRMAVAALNNDPQSVKQEEAAGAYTRLSTPLNNNFGQVNFTLLHWERSISVPFADARSQAAVQEQTVEIFVAAPAKEVTYRGANIPLGLQEFLRFFQAKNSAFAAAKELYNVLRKPAAKQMLLTHVNSRKTVAENPEQDTFQTQLDSIGFPQRCKKIAISNGSGYGQAQPFSPGQKIIQYHPKSS